MADVQRLRAWRLVPVVELTPWRFSERDPPQGPAHDHQANWARHWLDCLEGAGVTGLSPIAPGSWHVACGAFTDLATLDRVVRKLVEPDALTDPEAGSALSGGLALVSDGAVLAEPNCCGDLKDWCEWRAIADHRDPEWKMVWTGHPWLSARADGTDLIFSGPHESDAPEPRWALARDAIGPAVEAAVQELEVFADRLTVVLLDTAPQNGPSIRALARRLAGLRAPAEPATEQP